MMSSLPRPPSESERLLSTALTVGLISAAAALVLFTWLGREVMAGISLALDDRIRSGLHTLASPTLTTVMEALSLYGGPSGLIPLGIVLASGFLLRRWTRGALLVVVTMAGAGLLNWGLKYFFARPRPTAYFGYPLPLSASFPSGHAFFAASFFGGLAALSTGRIQSRRWRIVVWLTAVVLTLLVGLSRVYLGVHYPSDVLAGYAAAVVWVSAVAWGDRLLSWRRRAAVS
jgi:membrane-associated phospholipid phosphatase